MGYQAWNLLHDDYEYWAQRLRDEYEDEAADRELRDDPDAALWRELEEVEA